MIQVIDKKRCSGCTSCASICPKNCISMSADEEGFLYPLVDVSSCIDCHLCETKCPVLNPLHERKPKHCLAAKNNNEQIRLTSSSGGVFTAMAKNIINQGGVVCGVEFDEIKMPHHICVQSVDQIEKLVGSKYVQSRLENVFKEIKDHVTSGRKVLFTGTPCQVAGLNKFLGRLSEKDNLISVELCCHGVPSPLIWKKYLDELGVESSKIKTMTFRSKANGWRNYSIDIQTDSLHLCEGKEQNAYMRGFLNNLYCRPICSDCKARSFATGSDISMGDFWGLPVYYPQKNDNRGQSLLLVLTEKGQCFYDNIKDELDAFNIKYEEAIGGNTNLVKSIPSNVKRPLFWNLIGSGRTVVDSVTYCLRETCKEKIKRIIKKICRR